MCIRDSTSTGFTVASKAIISSEREVQGRLLLTFAEARNENLSAPDTEVYDAVNQLRQRPSVNLPPLPSGLSKDQMREAIRLERRLEFAFEGMHLFDTRSRCV